MGSPSTIPSFGPEEDEWVRTHLEPQVGLEGDEDPSARHYYYSTSPETLTSNVLADLPPSISSPPLTAEAIARANAKGTIRFAQDQ